MGFYPKALYHYYHRPKGISQVILIYCSDGKGWVEFQKERIGIQAGELIIIPINTPHTYGADKKDPWTIHWFHLIGNSNNETIEAIMDKNADLRVKQVGFSEERNSLFKQMAETFLNDSINTSNRAIKFMQENLSKTLSLDNIAQSAHLSVSFFSRKFKQETGYAPIEYFNHLRIQKACQLLHFSQLRINEVASEIGIDDPFYFSRLFKLQMGVSPVQYRKRA